MSKRKTLSPRTRFAVLRAGGFRCRYCGRRPPDVTLVIDHVIPVAAGGSSDFENLVAACQDCNAGKGAQPASGAATVAWMPIWGLREGRCPDDRHNAPWTEAPITYDSLHMALVCDACHFIVALRQLAVA